MNQDSPINPIAESTDSAETASNEDQPQPQTGQLIGFSLTARLVTDTGSQIFNPFLPYIASGLNISPISLGWMVGLRSALGVLAPLFGSLADRHGFRNILCFGLVCGSLGTLIVGLATNWWTASIGMAIWGIGLAGFVPTLHAYLGACLPYKSRARGIGIVEYGWALAGIIGLFSAGWLIRTWNWRAPFFVLSCCMLVMAAVFLLLPRPSGSKQVVPGNQERSTFSLVEFFRLGPNARSAYAIIIGGSLAFFAAMQIYIAHGTWLVTQYGTGPAALGTIAMLFGFSDLLGSVSVSLFTDSIGKRRSVIMGLVATAVAYILLPFLNQGLILAVLGIALARLCFEFTIVSNITLLSEQVPEQRGKVMTLGAAAGLIGMTLAGGVGPWLYLSYGVWGLTTVSTVLTSIALIIYLALTKERHAE